MVNGELKGVVMMIFFVQAEDGIRDLVQSRGLGDVYKRQALSITPTMSHAAGPQAFRSNGRLIPILTLANGTIALTHGQHGIVSAVTHPTGLFRHCAELTSGGMVNHGAVSYTHLTLPTIYSV